MRSAAATCCTCVCDLSIAADTAIFGQTGPRVGSVDPGFGTAYLARVIGEKKAREIWYLCRQYNAAEALAMGLVNKVVPATELRAEVETWCAELLAKSPTALRIAKQSFNADSDHIHGIGGLGFSAVELYYEAPRPKRANRPSWRSAIPTFGNAPSRAARPLRSELDEDVAAVELDRVRGDLAGRVVGVDAAAGVEATTRATDRSRPFPRARPRRAGRPDADTYRPSPRTSRHS